MSVHHSYELFISPWPWVLEEMLGLGADLNKCDEKGQTPLISAVKGGHEGIVEQILNREADEGICDEAGETPFLWAVRRRYKGIVQLLITAIRAKNDLNIGTFEEITKDS